MGVIGRYNITAALSYISEELQSCVEEYKQRCMRFVNACDSTDFSLVSGSTQRETAYANRVSQRVSQARAVQCACSNIFEVVRRVNQLASIGACLLFDETNNGRVAWKLPAVGDNSDLAALIAAGSSTPQDGTGTRSTMTVYVHTLIEFLNVDSELAAYLRSARESVFSMVTHCISLSLLIF